MFREMRIEDWFHSFFTDCRFACRQLHKAPTFTTVAVLTLALGIGSSTAIFSTIDGALLHPYPYKNAERLATFTVFSAEQFRAWRFPGRAFVDFKERNHIFDDMFGLVYREVRFTSAVGTEEFSGGSVTLGTFESLGIPALFGRGLTADDYKPGAPPVFVISYGLWTKLFHRASHVLGNTYTLNGAHMALVGIMPTRFQYWPRGTGLLYRTPILDAATPSRYRLRRSLISIARPAKQQDARCNERLVPLLLSTQQTIG